MSEIIKSNLPHFAEETEAGSNCSRLWPEKIQVSIWNIQQQTRTLVASPPVQGLLASSTRETKMAGRIHTWLVTPPESEKAFIAQSCPNPCDAVDCSPPDSSVHGILQARIQEWVAISSSRGSSQPRVRTHQPRDQTWVSCIAGRFFTLWATREAHENHKRFVSGMHRQPVSSFTMRKRAK